MLKVQEIRELIKLIDESSINEFTYEADGAKVSMKKSSENNEVQVVPQVIVPTQAPQVAAKPEATQVNAEISETASVTQEAPANTAFDYEIVSPMVGTFYTSANPDSAPYVSVGSKVQQDTVVCIVEAMKLFNEIEAETTGEIVEILVGNGELVEYGQPLFRVKTK